MRPALILVSLAALLFTGCSSLGSVESATTITPTTTTVAGSPTDSEPTPTEATDTASPTSIDATASTPTTRPGSEPPNSTATGPTDSEASSTTTTSAAATTVKPAAPPPGPVAINKTVDVDYEAASPQQWSIDFNQISTVTNPDGGYWLLLDIDAVYRGTDTAGSLLDLTIEVTTARETLDWWFDSCLQPPEPVLDQFTPLPAGQSVSGTVCFESPSDTPVTRVGVAGLIDDPVSVPVG